MTTIMKKWYSPNGGDQLLYHPVSPLFLYHSISFNKVFGIFKSHFFLMFAQTYKLRQQGRATSRYSVRFSYFSHTWKRSSERTVPMGRIPGKRIIWGCHICGPFLATLFTIHSRLSLPPPELESFSLVICPLWSVLFHQLVWMGMLQCRPAQRRGNAKGPGIL